MDTYKYYIRACAMLVAITISIASCKTQHIAGETIIETVEIHHRDTTIVTMPDSASAMALLRCDSDNQVILERMNIVDGERIKLQYQLNHIGDVTEMVFDCKEDSLKNIIEVQEKEINRLKQTTVVEYVNQKDFIWYTGLFAIIAVAIALVFFIVIMVIKVVK